MSENTQLYLPFTTQMGGILACFFYYQEKNKSKNLHFSKIFCIFASRKANAEQSIAMLKALKT